MWLPDNKGRKRLEKGVGDSLGSPRTAFLISAERGLWLSPPLSSHLFSRSLEGTGLRKPVCVNVWEKYVKYMPFEWVAQRVFFELM